MRIESLIRSLKSRIFTICPPENEFKVQLPGA
jgi:hypothetical protein